MGSVKISKKSIEILLFHIVVCDILFFPYMSIIATTYTQFVVFIWFLLKKPKCFNLVEYKAYFVFLFLAVTSTVLSVFILPHWDYVFGLKENIKRLFQFSMGLSYYFFFYYCFKNYILSLRKYLIFFILVTTLWAIIYYYNFNLYIDLKQIFNSKDAFLSITDDSYIYRFSYIWSDPNNIGYTIVGVFFVLVYYEKFSISVNVLILCFILFVLLMVMSSGSWLSLLLLLPFLLYLLFVDFYKQSSLMKTTILLLLVPLFIYVAYELVLNIIQADVAIHSVERLESNSGDSRFRIWKTALSTHNLLFYLFFGTGFQFYVGNRSFSTHSGHLMLMYSYGVIAYLIYMYLVFRKRRGFSYFSYLWIIPFFICFTINIGIGEQKFVGVLYLLIAYTTYKNTSKL